MCTSSDEFDSRVDRFDTLWHSGTVPEIEDFLPPPDSPQFDRRLLTELVMIDLEFRWRGSVGNSHDPDQTSPVAEEAPRGTLPSRPRLEDYLQRYPQLGPPDQLPTELLGEEYRARQRWGDHPTHEEYLKRFRGHGSELQAELRRIDAESARIGSSVGLRVRCPHCHGTIDLITDAVTNVCCPSCGSRFSLLSEPERGDGAEPLLVGHFELLQKLGSGTFGTVWKARDRELDRVVAVKIPRHIAPDDTQSEPFLREARVAAQLNHPNIVTVHEVGRDEQTVFIVTDFVVGDSLSNWLDVRRPSFFETAELCAKIADALHHAHQAGVIHRDLKPQNILVDGAGEPKLTDFGLARRRTGEVTMTVDGQVLGTPAYMSPEQAQGRSHQADSRSDIYSLGVILFQMLTGEMPFRGSVHMLMHQIMHDDPPYLRQLNSHVPRDLETICLKCLEKDPRRRYASSEDLAEDLRRYVRGEPIQARPISRPERTWRWCQRKPMAATVVAILSLIAIVAPMVAWNQSRLAAKEAEAREQNRRQLYVADMVVAQQAWEAANVGRVRQLLARHVPGSHETDLRGFQWYYLWQVCKRGWTVPTLTGHNSNIWSLAFSPDGKTLASGSTDGAVFLWDVKTKRRRVHLEGHTGGVLSLAFTPDGEHLASAGSFDNTVKIWKVESGELERQVRTNLGVPCVAISHDGQMLAWGEADGTVSLCDFGELKRRNKFEGRHAGWVTSIVFSHDGTTLASGSTDFKINLWDVETRQLRREPLEGHENWVRGLAISPDGAMIATAGHDKTVRLWDMETGECRKTLQGHRARLWSVAFSPDGSTLVSSSSDGSVRLWDVALGVEKDRLMGHENPTVLAVAYSPDGTTVASAGADAKIRLWDVTTRSSRDTILGHSQDVIWIAFSPDGKTLASASADTKIKLWDVATGLQLSTLEGHTSWVGCVAFSSDGTKLASAGQDGIVKLWDAKSGEDLHSLVPGDELPPLYSVAFSPDDRTLAAADHAGVIRLWDVETRRERATLVGHNSIVWPIAFSPDGRTLASGGWIDKTVRLWEVATGQSTILGEHTGPVYSIAFSRDGLTLASGSEDTTIKLWNVVNLKERETLRGHAGEVRSVVFSPDGTSLASGSGDTTIKLWYLGTIREPETLTGHQSAVSSVTFSPNGLILASASEDATVRLWRRATEREVQSMIWQP